MREELMDKEVLCILDTRQIQRYMFRTNAYFDSLGASDLMTHILGDAILFALRHVEPCFPKMNTTFPWIPARQRSHTLHRRAYGSS